MIVENAGFGAEAAAPIARRVLDFLLVGRYPSVEDIALVREGKVGAPIGAARLVAEMPLPPISGAGSGATAVAEAAAVLPVAASAPAPAASAAKKAPAASAPARVAAVTP